MRRSVRPTDRSTAVRRVALVVLGASSLVVGLWAQVLPRSFYDDFPGLGRVWVAVDGPYNEHLVRDVGGLNLALALVLVAALVTGDVLLARVAGGAALVYGLPHLVYHATNLDGVDALDVVAMLVALGLAVLAALVALALPDEAGEPAVGPPGSAGSADRPAG